MGTAFGSALSIVYLFIHKRVFIRNNVKYAFLLSLIMCAVLFVIPFLKYPGNPPAVGIPETIYYRDHIYRISSRVFNSCIGCWHIIL